MAKERSLACVYVYATPSIICTIYSLTRNCLRKDPSAALDWELEREEICGIITAVY